MKCIPRPYDHLQIRSAIDDYPLYSHIIFLGSEETETTMKILTHYGYTSQSLKEKRLYSFFFNDTLEKYRISYTQTNEKKLRQITSQMDGRQYLFIPRASHLYPRFFSLLSQKEIRFQAPAVVDQVD